jgi:hypothetical protein
MKICAAGAISSAIRIQSMIAHPADPKPEDFKGYFAIILYGIRRPNVLAFSAIAFMSGQATMLI